MLFVHKHGSPHDLSKFLLIFVQRLAVEIVVSGIAFHSDDFVKPWEAADGDLERYDSVAVGRPNIAILNILECAIPC